MSFHFARSSNSETCWLPAPETDPVTCQEEEAALVTITLDHQDRLALRSLATMAMIYNAEFSKRVQLGHDCGVFAFSCEAGDPLEDVDFTCNSKDNVSIGSMGIPRPIGDYSSQEAAKNAGRMLFVVSEEITDPHIIVQATADDQEPLYLSKVGVEGPVILSDVDHIAGIYHATMASVISNLSPNVRQQG